MECWQAGSQFSPAYAGLTFIPAGAAPPGYDLIAFSYTQLTLPTIFPRVTYGVSVLSKSKNKKYGLQLICMIKNWPRFCLIERVKISPRLQSIFLFGFYFHGLLLFSVSVQSTSGDDIYCDFIKYFTVI